MDVWGVLSDDFGLFGFETGSYDFVVSLLRDLLCLEKNYDD